MFTTNANKLLLLVIIYILIAYYFIISKLANIFIFINKYIKELFFYNSYRGPIVIFRDFAARLTAAIVARYQLSMAKINIKVAYKLAIRLDKVGSNLFLQLYSQYMVEVIKK